MLERLEDPKLQETREFVSQIVDSTEVDVFIAAYALSTRRYEMDGSHLSDDMIRATRVTVGQQSADQSAGFKAALEVARILLPVKENERLRF